VAGCEPAYRGRVTLGRRMPSCPTSLTELRAGWLSAVRVFRLFSPSRLQFYCNGHNWLARQLDRKKIGYRQVDNAFTTIEDWAAAQELSDRWDASSLHRKLDEFSDRYCPVLKPIEESYHGSLEETEYATDIVFRRQADLQPFYGN